MAPRSTLALTATLACVLASIILWFFATRTEPRPGEILTPLPAVGVEDVNANHPLVEKPSTDSGRAPVAASVTHQPTSNSHEDTKDPIERARPIQLSGTVTDSGGRAISGQNGGVGLTSATGDHRSAEIKNGRYAIEGLEPGQYVLGCSMHGFTSVERLVTLRSDEIEHREDITLASAWMITVHILTPDGEDLRTRLQKEPMALWLQLSVLSTVESPGDQLSPDFGLDRSGEGVSSSKSWWGQGEERDDRIQVRVEPPIYVSIVVRDQVLATQRVQDRIEELTFTIGVDRLRDLLSGFVVKLLDGESGLPATDAWVNLATAQSTESAVHPDEQGIVRYADRVPGLYELHAHLKDRAAVTQTVDLQPGGVTDLGTITFKKGNVIQGKCVDTEGHPKKVEACLVPIPDGASTSAGRPQYLYTLKMDDQGLFAITSLPVGQYLVRVPCSMPSALKIGGESGWTVAPILIDTRTGPVENVVIVVQRPVATILRPVSTETDGMQYNVVTTDGLSYCDGGFGGSAPERLALAPGTYTLRLTRAHEPVRDIPFTVGSSPVTIDVAP